MIPRIPKIPTEILEIIGIIGIPKISKMPSIQKIKKNMHGSFEIVAMQKNQIIIKSPRIPNIVKISTKIN